ncbi:MAG: esterase-like activity of phytase family protein [Hyphomonadaceae bacterium]|nr:esterase-like activity of phytase family protein [Hyphomonadaceae bacterium]
MAVRIERLDWTDIPIGEIALPKKAMKLTLGLGSGLTRRPGDPPGRVFAVTDRGPNIFASTAVDGYGLTGLERFRGTEAKFMPLPAIGPEIVELQVEGAAVRLIRRLPLRTQAGHRLSGLPLLSADSEDMEHVLNLDGGPLDGDARLGADAEAIAAMPDGAFFVAEEYGPSLLRVDTDGVVTARWVPASLDMPRHPDLPVLALLPHAAATRRPNRGLEALCASANGDWLYLGMQSALANEDEASIPIWKLDATTGALVAERRYPFDAPASFKRDAARRKVGPRDLKICEFAWAGEDQLIVLERIAHTSKLYLIDLARLPEKRLLFSTDDHGEIGPDIEGMTLLSRTEILLVSDNDFGVEGAQTEFWRITLDAPL